MFVSPRERKEVCWDELGQYRSYQRHQSAIWIFYNVKQSSQAAILYVWGDKGEGRS